MRKTTSSSSSPSSPPRSAGVDRYGRSGGESTDFHSGPITTKASAVKQRAIVLRVRRKLHRAGHCEVCDAKLINGQCPTSIKSRARDLNRRGHCPRCDSRLVGGKCPSCGADPRFDFDDEDDDHGHLDDVGLLGDDLQRRGRFD